MKKLGRVGVQAFKLLLSCALLGIACSGPVVLSSTESTANASAPVSSTISSMTEAELLEKIQADTFRYFWETTDPETGLAPDRYPSESPASIAAIGFALTAYAVGVEKGTIQRSQAAERTLKTLRFLWQLPMGPEPEGTAGYQGFFYHFLKMENGHRSQAWEIELSTVDTALLIIGALFAQSYFDGENAAEKEIRDLAEKLYRRVNWNWAENNPPLISLGWFPGKGFIEYDWVGYNEAMLVYILALASPTHPVDPSAWTRWTENYGPNWGTFFGQEHLTFAPMFGHQYSHVWIDFRGIQDAYMREKNSDYFINSRKAAYSQRQYAIENPMGWQQYSENIWGLTACDGPGDFEFSKDGKTRKFLGYHARGVGINHSFDDGTLTPTALVGSLPFAPEIILPAIKESVNRFGEHILTDNYGFVDAYNPSFQYGVNSKTGRVIDGFGWVAKDLIGIDQGPILLMIENHQSGLIWEVMRKNPHIRRGLVRAGFTGGWLD